MTYKKLCHFLGPPCIYPIVTAGDVCRLKLRSKEVTKSRIKVIFMSRSVKCERLNVIFKIALISTLSSRLMKL